MKKILIVFLTISILFAGCASEEEDDRAVVIVLVDTGVSTQAISSDQVLEGWNYVRNSDDTQDRINHGTAVASVILGSESAAVAGKATHAHIIPLVVTDKDGSIQSVSAETLAQVIRDGVDRYDADILNISLGIKTDDPNVKDAVAYAEEQGVLIVSAVGNEGDCEDIYYPSGYETVIAVGSHDKAIELSHFSQRNGTVDILAPGEDIWLASKNGKTYGARGTSYATGYVTAAAANLLAQNPGLSPAQVRERLYQSTTDIGPIGFDTDSGWGILTEYP